MADPDAWPKPFHRTDLVTEFIRQADNPDPDALARFEATLAPDGDGQADTAPGAGSLRDRVAAALEAAANKCDGDCGLDENTCYEAHPINWSAMVAGTTHVDGAVTAIADTVLAVVRPELDRAGQAEAALARVRAQCAEWAEPTKATSWDARIRDDIAAGCADMIRRALDGSEPTP
jgi:hypothetical protein